MQILTQYLALLALCASSSCLPTDQKQVKPVFTLHNITYHSSVVYSTPAHLATKYGTVEFNLTNTAIPYTTHCIANSQQYPDFFYGDIIYTCDAPPATAGANAKATFTFSYPGQSFAVNQTWSCNGKDISVAGSGKGNMACTNDYWTNSNWTLGQLYSIYSTDCRPSTLDIIPV
ncbi:hypothetical protein BGZ60DRAFT_422446 [Tricladium varicosporioides]|nr:hypothetical protein BGZ60DRAFT_422446 [Hymenoscyphus varicosporioides]